VVVVCCVWQRGYSINGGAATSDELSLGGEYPLNPAVVERPVVGRPLTRWKIQFARLRAHQHSLLLLLSNNAADRVCADERLVSCSFNPITSFTPRNSATRQDLVLRYASTVITIESGCSIGLKLCSPLDSGYSVLAETCAGSERRGKWGIKLSPVKHPSLPQ
jgi:hypothetical protein